MSVLKRCRPELMVLFCSIVAVALSLPMTAMADRLPIGPMTAHWLASKADDDTVDVWVLFTDKGIRASAEIEKALQRAELRLGTRTLERRAKVRRGGLVDMKDLDVCARYIDAVLAAGARHRTTSRWLNGVSVEAPAGLVAEIAELPFVREIRRVAAFSRPEIVMPRPQEVSAPGGRETRAFDYGYSLAQLEQINVPAVHDLGLSGAGVIVCMLDTGFFRDHQALDEIDLIAEWDFINDDGNTADESGDPYGQHDHGTLTLSTLGGFAEGALIGPAYGASFLLAKTEDTGQEQPIEEDWWTEGIEWAEANGADVVSSSLGYLDWYSFPDMDGLTCTTTLAANWAAENGVVVCNANGNEGQFPGAIIAPADAFNILSCGAVDSSGSLAYFSSSGPTYDGRIKPEICARGVSTVAAAADTAAGYTWASGTSLSTPLIGGAVALLLEAHPGMPPALVIEALKSTASMAETPNNYYGWGIIDVLEAINAAGLYIDHDPLPDTRDEVNPYPVVARISSPDGVNPNALFVYYETASRAFAPIPMEPTGGEDEYGASIPAQPAGTEVRYYIYAEDLLGESAVNPADAPVGYYSFTVDRTAPAISAVAVSFLSDTEATITWATDEPATSVVHYGEAVPPAGLAQDGALTTSHSVTLSGLQDSTLYYFSVESADEAGNPAVDDNGGLYYTFITHTFLEDFFDDMEGGPGSWEHGGSGDEWELGIPTYGPSAAHSGSTCWGTDLDDTYSNSAAAALITPFTLSEGSQLFFWHWYDLESGWDDGSVMISSDGGETWTNITPGGTYTGSSGGWIEEQIDLSGYSGDVKLAFLLTSDSMVQKAGWYIDDVAVGRVVTSGVHYDGHVLYDSDPGGDGDGYAEPGETIGLAVTLVNISETAAYDVSTVISSGDPNVTILQDSVTYGDIPSGGEASGAELFVARIDADCPVGHSIPINLEISAAGAGPWWDGLTVRVESVSTISGRVVDLDSGLAVPGATVLYEGPADGSVSAGPDGAYLIAGLAAGSYSVWASASGYADSDAVDAAVPPDVAGIDFALGAPQIVIDPAALAAEIPSGGATELILNIGNEGNQALLFEITEDEASRGSGGPDLFGHRWIDSDEPGGPAFGWIDITGIGTEITGLSDDTNVGPFPIGFEVPFFEGAFSTFRFCTNGWISFTDTSSQYSNYGLPSTEMPEDLIAPFFDDLTFRSGGSAWYWSNGVDTLIVSWVDVPHYGATGGPYSFQVILNASGRILFQYQSVAAPLDSATVGIQNGAQDDGLQIALDEAYLHDSLAVRISSDVEWLEADPAAGSVEPGGVAPVTVSFDATGMTDGVYSALLLVSSNDPDDGEVIVPVTLVVGGECWDVDGDGYLDEACGGTDCDDADPAVNPGADEICTGGVDEDCDGLLDDDDPNCAAQFTLELGATYEAGTLSLDFTLGATEPVLWTTILILTSPAPQVVPLWTLPSQAIDPPVDFPVSFPLPGMGWVGIYTGLLTAEGAQASDHAWVNTD